MLWKHVLASVWRFVTPEMFSAIWSDESRRGWFQSRALFPSPSLSVSLRLSVSQSVSAPRSFVLSPPPKRHTCVARKSSRRHGNSCQASGEPLLTWPQRRQSAGRARSRDAGGLMLGRLTEQRLAVVEGNDDWNTKWWLKGCSVNLLRHPLHSKCPSSSHLSVTFTPFHISTLYPSVKLIFRWWPWSWGIKQCEKPFSLVSSTSLNVSLDTKHQIQCTALFLYC